jgi:hypothetical protein
MMTRAGAYVPSGLGTAEAPPIWGLSAGRPATRQVDKLERLMAAWQPFWDCGGRSRYPGGAVINALILRIGLFGRRAAIRDTGAMTSRQEWLLMGLAHRKGQPLTPAQIQKAMFLMREEASALVGPKFYNFIAYNYGPFDANVYHDLDDLAQKGLVVSVDFPGRNWKLYSVTAAGLTEGTRVKQTANKLGAGYLEQVVDWVSSLTFPQLVRAIYAKYPKYKANSVFTG